MYIFDLRNLPEQLKKPFCFKKCHDLLLFELFCSSDLNGTGQPQRPISQPDICLKSMFERWHFSFITTQFLPLEAQQNQTFQIFSFCMGPSACLLQDMTFVVDQGELL